MAAIKNWFKKKKLDAKFSTAGSGHNLSEPSGHNARPQQTPHRQQVQSQTSRDREAHESAQRAGLAAIQRHGGPDGSGHGGSGGGAGARQMSRSEKAIKAQVRQEMESERRRAEAAYLDAEGSGRGGQGVHSLDAAPVLAVEGVYFTCPILGDDVTLPRDQLMATLEDFLRAQAADEPLMSYSLMIHSLNPNFERRTAGVELLNKIIRNIQDNPGEEKFRKLKLSGKAMSEKISVVKGAVEFLEALGFEQTSLSSTEDPSVQEPYLVLPPSDNLPVTLNLAQEYLNQAEPMPIQICRNPKVYSPNSPAGRTVVTDSNLPPAFFDRTSEELKAEQSRRSEDVERMMMLRTKEMRERDERRRLYRYRYALLRFRFPDGYSLEATFRSNETMPTVVEFLRPCLSQAELPFDLRSSGGALTRPSGNGAAELDLEGPETLAELGLTPAVVLMFSWDPDVAAAGMDTYLSEEMKANAI